jgi:hypothetical protein
MVSDELNRNDSDYDTFIKKILLPNNNTSYSLNELYDLGHSEIQNFYAKWLKDRCWNLSVEGIIANPRISFYKAPITNPETELDKHESWKEVIKKARDLIKRNKLFDGINGLSYRVINIEDNGSGDEIIVEETSSRSRSIVKEQTILRAIVRINACGGICQQPVRKHLERAVLVACLKRLYFNKDQYVQVVDIPSGVDIFSESEGRKMTSIRQLVNQSRRRALGGSQNYNRNRQEIPHELNEGWIIEKEKVLNCEVTGIPFTDEPGPFARSLDQRSPGKGYTPENIDVVVRIYNYAKNIFDVKDVEYFCQQYVENMKR